LISDNSKLIEVVLGGHSLGELGEPLRGEQTIYTTQSPADEVGHATTNLQEAENEGKGKFDCFVLPCQVIQWRWLSKFLLLLSFHALFEPMVSKLMLGAESALMAEHSAKTWRPDGRLAKVGW
jgi:hypothetical protein